MANDTHKKEGFFSRFFNFLQPTQSTPNHNKKENKEIPLVYADTTTLKGLPDKAEETLQRLTRNSTVFFKHADFTPQIRNDKPQPFDKILSTIVGYEFFQGITATKFQQYLFSSQCQLTVTIDCLKKIIFDFIINPQCQLDNVKNTIAELITNNELAIYEVANGVILCPPTRVKYVQGKVQQNVDQDSSWSTPTVSLQLQITEEEQYPLYNEEFFLPQDEIQALVNLDSKIAYCTRFVKLNNLIFGKVTTQGYLKILIPQDPNLQYYHFVITNAIEGSLSATNDSGVLCQVVDRHTDKIYFVTVYAYANDMARLDLLLYKNVPNLDFTENAQISQQLARLPNDVTQADKADRKDLTQLPFVTIDEENACDFDDAVYCTQTTQGYKLYVAIADVTHYVQPDSPLDNEAKKRGYSLYLPHYISPMLPPKITNDLCSLKPHVDRLSMVCEIDIQQNGEVNFFQFYPAIINSHAHLTYNTVASILQGNNTRDTASIAPHIHMLSAVSQILHKKRKEKHAIEIPGEQVNFLFDQQFNVIGMLPAAQYNDAYRLIAECMILVNTCAAYFVEKQYGTLFYRVNPMPMRDKIINLHNAVQEYVGSEAVVSSRIMDIIDFIQQRDDAQLLNIFARQAMMSAQYSMKNIEHYGLSVPYYAHFTAPIRRYADIILHREIKYLLSQSTGHEIVGAKQYTDLEMAKLVTHCNVMEQQTTLITRTIDKVLKAKIASQYIGQDIVGVISNIASFGLFVHLDHLQCDGLVHGSTISRQYKRAFQMGSARSGSITVGYTRFAIGAKVLVRILSVDVAEGRIALTLSSTRGNHYSETIQYQQPMLTDDMLSTQQVHDRVSQLQKIFLTNRKLSDSEKQKLATELM